MATVTLLHSKKSLQSWLADYAVSHQHPINKKNSLAVRAHDFCQYLRHGNVMAGGVYFGIDCFGNAVLSPSVYAIIYCYGHVCAVLLGSDCYFASWV